MRIVRFLDANDQVHCGADRGDGTADILAAGAADAELISANSPRRTGKILPTTRPTTPLAPKNIFCIGLNYVEHVKEGGRPIPKHPVIFMKPTTAVIGPGDRIRIPAICAHEVDFECELAVIVGKPGRDIREDRALEHVFGYTVANDVSARKWQREGGGGQWIRGKSFDTFCPLGPVILTARPTDENDTDFIADPQDLRLKTTLNGQVMQDGHTADMIFPVARLISFISRDTTLLAGTLILTGTPPGVGVARDPQVFLKPGDRITVAIDGIGEVRNEVVGSDEAT